MSIQRPTLPFLSKWAEKGERVNVPNEGANHNDGRADIETGFPKQTMISALKGGVPPWGTDHNGILYQVTEAIQWMQAGGLPNYSKEFSDRNGGYANGTILQGNDSNRPWVLWQCVQDGNTFDPNQNKINVSTPQNGWIRYPVIDDNQNNTLYYSDEGKLLIASPTVITSVYVSTSQGSDQTGDGSYAKPFYSITKAISVTPASGGVTIFLKAGDVFYMSDGGVDKLETDGNLGVYIGSRYITIQPYDDPILQNAQNAIAQAGADNTFAYCLNNINRPKLITLWGYKTMLDNSGSKNIQYTYLYGFYGDFNRFKVHLCGIDISINDVEGLSNSPYGLWTNFTFQGGIFEFTGCVFNKMPTGNWHPFMNLGAGATTNISFTYGVYFTEDTNNTKGQLMNTGTPLTVTCWEDKVAGPVQQGLPNLIGNPSNGVAYMKRKSAFAGNIGIVKNPSPSYINLNTNFEINMDA